VGKLAFKKLLAYSRASKSWACGKVDIQLLAFNDFHGSLQPPAGSLGKVVTGPVPATDNVDAGGAEFLATHINTLRAKNPNTLVVTAGDNIGATPLLSGLFRDEPTIEALDSMGMAYSALGNHELDESLEELLRVQKGGCHPVDGCQGRATYPGAAFQYLAANVIVDATGDTLLPGYEIRYFQGAKVAMVGISTKTTPEVCTAAGTRGLSFLDEAETINAIVPKLKKEGAQTIVVLMHEGGAATGLYNECKDPNGVVFGIASKLDPMVSVVIAGHTHTTHVCDMGGRLITSAGSNGRLVTDIDMTVHAQTGELLARAATNVIVTRTVDKDSAMTAIIKKWDALSAPLANKVVGSVTKDLTRTANPAGESSLGDVIADTMLAATASPETGNAVIAVMNSGGIRADIVAAQISGGEQPGELTYAEAFSVQPFGNNLITLTLTGAQIDTLLEQQFSLSGGVEKASILQVSKGFTYEYDPVQPIGSRVNPASIRLNGAVLDPNATYRVTCNNYLAEGGGGATILKSGTDRLPGVIDLDALVAYFASASPVAPGSQDRIVRK
jgi:5'-nucleotidase